MDAVLSLTVSRGNLLGLVWQTIHLSCCLVNSRRRKWRLGFNFSCGSETVSLMCRY